MASTSSLPRPRRTACDASAGRAKVLLSPEDCREFLVEGKPFKFNLYRIPFNEGQGGKPEPLPGATDNGMSN